MPAMPPRWAAGGRRCWAGRTMWTMTATSCCTRHPVRAPNWIFIAVPDEKVVKNRIHLDFRPDDQQAEVDRVLGLGARRVDIGQRGDESWVVLADPEGNEFCILAATDD